MTTGQTVEYTDHQIQLGGNIEDVLKSCEQRQLHLCGTALLLMGIKARMENDYG